MPQKVIDKGLECDRLLTAKQNEAACGLLFQLIRNRCLCQEHRGINYQL